MKNKFLKFLDDFESAFIGLIIGIAVANMSDRIVYGSDRIGRGIVIIICSIVLFLNRMARVYERKN